eukprot:c25831_g1_i4 orf=332-1825(-)
MAAMAWRLSLSPFARFFPSPSVVAFKMNAAAGFMACTRRCQGKLFWTCSKNSRPSSDTVPSAETDFLEVEFTSGKSSRNSVEDASTDPGGGENKRTEEGSYERLFSNLNEATLKHEPGWCWNSCYPHSHTRSRVSGIIPYLLSLLVVYGLLIAEVNVNTMCELGSGGVSLVSMAMRTLGKNGVRVACVAYLFIHYALLVAYVARSGDILSNAVPIPYWLSTTAFSGAMGGLCYFGSRKLIGAINGTLVFGIIGSFSFLVLQSMSIGGLDWSSLSRANISAIPQSIPIIMLAFVYQNVVPVVCTSLEGDLPKIKSAVVLGTSIPLIMFVVWDAVILGSISEIDVNNSGQIIDPLLQIRSSNGIVGLVIDTFSLLAVATSYIGFVLGLTDFLSDLLRLPADRGKEPLPYILAVLPPIVFALLNPDIFFTALDFAGTYGVLVLFGILPPAMAWAERYTDACVQPSIPPLVPGNRIMLGAIIGTAGCVITSQFFSLILYGK